MTTAPTAGTDAVEAFIARWKPSGGAENAAAKSFIDELCALLGVAKPGSAQETILSSISMGTI